MDSLLRLLKERSFSRREVILASGLRSNFFIDCKQSVLSAEGHLLVAKAFWGKLSEQESFPDAIAGVALGGCSLASAVATYSAMQERPVDALYVRKAAKDHGSQRLIEGHDRLPSGAKVVVLEDVVTTGGSTMAAIGILKEAGLKVEQVIALVDRQEGGAEAIRDSGLKFSAIYTQEDFMGPSK
ncbi:MAG: orotate phosphoribosyltransferase [Myxococcales bacterium]|nr:MAG: orotate phosphoribosyltransferase [Myxococcales bacterium]